jgi:hypothetical protein
LAHVKLGAAPDEMIKMRPGKARKRIRMGFEPLEELAVAYQGNLQPACLVLLISGAGPFEAISGRQGLVGDILHSGQRSAR